LSGNVEVDAIVPAYFTDEIAGIVGDALGNCGPYTPFNQGAYGADLPSSTKSAEIRLN